LLFLEPLLVAILSSSGDGDILAGDDENVELKAPTQFKEMFTDDMPKGCMWS
jgi:hypothetical protein